MLLIKKTLKLTRLTFSQFNICILAALDALKSRYNIKDEQVILYG